MKPLTFALFFQGSKPTIPRWTGAARCSFHLPRRAVGRTWAENDGLTNEQLGRLLLEMEESQACAPPSNEKPLGPATTLYETVTPSLSSRLPRRAVGPERTRISCHAALDKAAYAPFF
jgi:hypothetical protein